ncbi:hypothetical protein BDD12DRAFT_872110 [Trichophaea hybrida]|nr:hypothetical protein BDD12DRAFT_872110 [Trichophaea hybrida]
MLRNKGKKKASASTSAPAPPTMFKPRVHTLAWVLEKIQRDTDEEEARIAAKDSHPEPTVPPSSSSWDKKSATVSRRRLPFGERLYDCDCGSDGDAPEWQSDDDSN